MRKVLHVGPCDTAGGMATVMHTLAEFPPEGWEAELLASHAPGGLWAKWRAYRLARHELKRRCSDPALRPDVVHVHTAADWSWRRKARLIRIAQLHAVPITLHIHSGRFNDWLDVGGPRRKKSLRAIIERKNIVGVVLSRHWAEILNPALGELMHVPNPVVVPVFDDEVIRNKNQMLLLGRNDPVKGHDFAIKIAQSLQQQRPSLRLSITGVEHAHQDVVRALGWVSDLKQKLMI